MTTGSVIQVSMWLVFLGTLLEQNWEVRIKYVKDLLQTTKRPILSLPFFAFEKVPMSLLVFTVMETVSPTSAKSFV